MELLGHFFGQANTALVFIGCVLGALLGGLVVGRRKNARLRGELVHARQQIARAEDQVREEQQKEQRMREELDTVASLALVLPHVVRELNRDDLDPRAVPRLILQLASAIFRPAEMLFYGARSAPGRQGEQQELYLVAHQGIHEVPRALKVIPDGQGKIGWVAEHQLDMVKEDWDNLARNDGVNVPVNDPSLKADLIAPLVHHAREDPCVLGVLCIGGPRIRPRDEKLLLQLVTNLGSMALVNTKNISQLRSLANHDGLTRLLNRPYFTEDLLPRTLVACGKEAQGLGLFIFDIDHFKNYNDTNGHPAGDDLLRGMAKIIKQCLRPGDLASRYGGEEFIIAMPETDRKTACDQAERIRETIATTRLPHGEKQPLGLVSISGGVAAFPMDGVSVNELIKHADEALYQAKRGGRNRVIAYKSVDIGDGGEGQGFANADDLPVAEPVEG